MFSLSSCGFARGIYIRAVYIYRFCFFPPILFEDPPLLDFLSAFFLSASLVRAKTSEREREEAQESRFGRREREKTQDRPRAGVSLPSKKKFVDLCCKCRALSVFLQHQNHIIFISLSLPLRAHTHNIQARRTARAQRRVRTAFI